MAMPIGVGLSLREAELRHALRRQGKNAPAGMHAAGGLEESLSSVVVAAAEAVPLSELCSNDDEASFLPTGWASIDEELLPGGVRRGHVTEVCGMSCSGKTRLCHSLTALTALAETSHRDLAMQHESVVSPSVVYIDTSNAFRASRVADTLAKDNSDVALRCAAMRLIDVHRPQDVWETFGVLQSVSRECSQNASWRPALLVVDSIPHVVSPAYTSGATSGRDTASASVSGSSHIWGQSLAAQLGMMLRALAYTYHIAIMVRMQHQSKQRINLSSIDDTCVPLAHATAHAVCVRVVYDAISFSRECMCLIAFVVVSGNKQCSSSAFHRQSRTLARHGVVECTACAHHAREGRRRRLWTRICEGDAQQLHADFIATNHRVNDSLESTCNAPCKYVLIYRSSRTLLHFVFTHASKSTGSLLP